MVCHLFIYLFILMLITVFSFLICMIVLFILLFKKVNVAFCNWLNLDPGGYNVFALSKDVISNLGYFDENFFPV